MTKEQLQTLLKDLKEARLELDRATAFYDELEKKFKEEHKDVIETIVARGQEVETLDKAIRELGVSMYDGISKEIGYGVRIRVMKKLEYDPATAFTWAKDHNLALQLDKKAFEDIAKSSTIEFVKVIETPSATIPSSIEVD